MAARAWGLCLGLIVVLLVAVVGLDSWQARQGERSILGIEWERAPRPPGPDAGRRSQRLRAAPPGSGVSRLAVIVEGFGGRQDLLDQVSSIDRALTIGVLPSLPLSQRLARQAARAGFEVLVQIPMEPYRYPELDPGPGALLVSMPPDEVTILAAQYLDQLPVAVGVMGHMGSRFVEDSVRVRALLLPMRSRRMLWVDTLASNLSVVDQTARALGIPAARRQVQVDYRHGEREARRRLDEAGLGAERRGEAVALVSAHPLTIALLRTYIPQWEARGIRLVPVSQLAR